MTEGVRFFLGIDRLLDPPSNYDGEKVHNEIFDIYQPKNFEKAKEIMDYGFDPADLAILPSEIPLTLRKPENYTKMISWILAEGQRRSKENNDE